MSDVVNLEITDVPLMLHVIETYMVGLKDAKEISIEDTYILDTSDKLLGSMAQYDEDYETLAEWKARLEIASGTQTTTGD